MSRYKPPVPLPKPDYEQRTPRPDYFDDTPALRPSHLKRSNSFNPQGSYQQWIQRNNNSRHSSGDRGGLRRNDEYRSSYQGPSHQRGYLHSRPMSLQNQPIHHHQHHHGGHYHHSSQPTSLQNQPLQRYAGHSNLGYVSELHELQNPNQNWHVAPAHHTAHHVEHAHPATHAHTVYQPPPHQHPQEYITKQPMKHDPYHGNGGGAPMTGYSSTGPLLPREATSMVCPSCTREVTTRVKYHSGKSTHLWAAFLCFFTCCLCGWLPYCCKTCKSVEHTCPYCDYEMGTV